MKHQWVNHSKNFVAPNTKAHTQTIEAIWSRLKKVFPENGVQQKLLMGYVRSFEWREKFTSGRSGFGIFLEHTKDIWNPHRAMEDPMTLEELVDPLVFVKPEVNDEVGKMGEMEEKRKSTKSKRRREEYETANLRRSNRLQTLEEEKMEAAKGMIQLKAKRKRRRKARKLVA